MAEILEAIRQPLWPVGGGAGMALHDLPCHTCAPRGSKDLSCVPCLVPRCLPHTRFCQAQECFLQVLKEMSQLGVVVRLYWTLLAMWFLQLGGREQETLEKDSWGWNPASAT